MSSFRVFDRFFKRVLTFLEKYPGKSEFLVSIGKTGCGKLSFIAVTPKFIYTKCYDPSKSRIFDCFLKLFDFS